MSQTINLPGTGLLGLLRNNNIHFENSNLLFGDHSIPYNHVEGYCYRLETIKHYLNGIYRNTKTLSILRVKYNNREYSLRSHVVANDHSHLSSELINKSGLFIAQLGSICNAQIAMRLLHQISQNGFCQIGDYRLSKDALTFQGFLSSERTIPLDCIAQVEIFSGNYIIRATTGEVWDHFSTDTINGPLLNDLIKYLKRINK